MISPHWGCALAEALTDRNMRRELQEATNVFRVLIKTLVKAGIIVADHAEEGIKYLQQLNGAGGDAAIFALGATAAE